jgi:hypothetical protein
MFEVLSKDKQLNRKEKPSGAQCAGLQPSKALDEINLSTQIATLSAWIGLSP